MMGEGVLSLFVYDDHVITLSRRKWCILRSWCWTRLVLSDPFAEEVCHVSPTGCFGSTHSRGVREVDVVTAAANVFWSETRWYVSCGESGWHLKDVRDRNGILEGVCKPEISDVGLLFLEVQLVAPLFHHPF